MIYMGEMCKIKNKFKSLQSCTGKKFWNCHQLISKFKSFYSQNVRITQVSRCICFIFVTKLSQRFPNLWTLLFQQPEGLERYSLSALCGRIIFTGGRKGHTASLPPHVGDLAGLNYLILRDFPLMGEWSVIFRGGTQIWQIHFCHISVFKFQYT